MNKLHVWRFRSLLLFVLISLNFSFLNSYKKELMVLGGITGVVGGILLYNYIQEKRETERMNSRSTEEVIYDCKEIFDKQSKFYQPYVEKVVVSKNKKDASEEFISNHNLIKFIQANYYKLSEKPGFWSFGTKYPLLQFGVSANNNLVELRKEKLWLDKRVTEMNNFALIASDQINNQDLSTIEKKSDYEKHFQTLKDLKSNLDNLVEKISDINLLVQTSDAYKIEQLTRELEIARAQQQIVYRY